MKKKAPKVLRYEPLRDRYLCQSGRRTWWVNAEVIESIRERLNRAE